MHQLVPESETIMPNEDSLYPYVNNDIKYRLFQDIVDSYYLDGQIKDDFQCNHNCYSYQQEWTVDDHTNTCTHEYHHMPQSIQTCLTILNKIVYILLKRMCHHSQMIM